MKHFPGLGNIEIETHTNTNSKVDISLEELKSKDLLPFKNVAEETNAFIMLSHVIIPDIDPDTPISYSNKAINGLIRSDWGSNNILVTDDFTMGAIYGSDDGVGGATIKALNTDLDFILISYDPELYYESMAEVFRAERAGRIDLKGRDDNIDRINAFLDQIDGEN